MQIEKARVRIKLSNTHIRYTKRSTLDMNNHGGLGSHDEYVHGRNNVLAVCQQSGHLSDICQL